MTSINPNINQINVKTLVDGQKYTDISPYQNVARKVDDNFFNLFILPDPQLIVNVSSDDPPKKHVDNCVKMSRI